MISYPMICSISIKRTGKLKLPLKKFPILRIFSNVNYFGLFAVLAIISKTVGNFVIFNALEVNSVQNIYNESTFWKFFFETFIINGPENLKKKTPLSK